MKINELRFEASSRLTACKIADEPRKEADMLISHAFNFTRLFMLTNPDLELDRLKTQRLFSLLERRCHGEPIQYIIGKAHFMGLEFSVTPDVLIPRPDTEILAAKALNEIKLNKYEKILDMCSGSGCIAISLAKSLPEISIHASDISESALNVARQNAVEHEIQDRVTFYKSNFFKQLPPETKYDIIVSNPPYIPKQDIEKLHIQVKAHEPRLALCGGNDGFDAYREIISEAPAYLNKRGALLLEAGINQAGAIKELMEKSFIGIHTIKDFGGVERVVCGALK